jgi:hypothetical protein
MKKRRPLIYLILALVLAFGSCNDPVFYIISQEQPIATPYINGSPTNFVEYKNHLYVASGSIIYIYNGTRWSQFSRPGGRVVQLAATTNWLYALTIEGSGNTKHVKQYGGNWNNISINNPLSIFAVNTNNVLFICAGGGDVNDNTIYYAEDSALPNPPTTASITNTANKSLLNGMAHNGTNYYLCTNSSGIFRVDSSSPGTAYLIGGSSINFTGIISIGTSVVAIKREEGNLYNVTTTTTTLINGVSFGGYSTGALAIWENPANTSEKLLLAGRDSDVRYTTGSIAYGYMEIYLDSGGNGVTGSFEEPGIRARSSVADNKLYISTLRKHPVNHIIQTPTTGRTLFASTQSKGVWSYRVRSGTPQWNAESEDDYR